MEKLLVKHIVERAATIFPHREIVARTGNNGRHRYTYADYYRRILKLGGALDKIGVEVGDGVGVLGWNSYQHLEIDYAAVCMGAIYQGLNFRVGVDSLVYMSNLAQNKVLFVEQAFLPLAEQMVAAGADSIEHFVLIADDPAAVNTSLTPLLEYEQLISGAPESYDFPDSVDENDPVAVCFTGGTTGRPKGCPYSNRFLVLRALTRQSAQSMGPYSGRDVFFITPPMFHGHAFNLPMDAFIVGAKMVIPGPHPDGNVFGQLISEEKVSRFMANPIMGKMLIQAVDEHGYDLSSIRHSGFGGDSVPNEMSDYFRKLGAYRSGGHGMAESLADHTAGFFDDLPEYGQEAAFELMQNNAGLPLVGCWTRVIGEDGQPVPQDGETMGEMQLKGWHVIPEYFRDPENSAKLFTDDGWLCTGDMGVHNPDNSYSFRTRSKDMIKSGGEWIPAQLLEQTVNDYANVREACVIGVAHPEFGERPLALITLHEATAADIENGLRQHLLEKLEKWMVPEFLVIDEIEKTTVGKFNKLALREQYESHYQGS